MGGLEGRGEAMGEEGRKGDGWEATVGKGWAPRVGLCAQCSKIVKNTYWELNYEGDGLNLSSCVTQLCRL